MSIRSSEYVMYNGRSSAEFNLVNVNLNTGLQSEPLVGRRTLRSDRVRGNDRPYFMGFDKEPLKFPITLAFMDAWDEERIRDAVRWLFSPQYYAPLVFSDDPDRIFYGLFVEDNELVHDCARSGYMTLLFECADPYSYTPVYEELHDLSANSAAGTSIAFNNFGDEDCLPTVTIEKVGDGDVSIINQSNGGAETTLTGLVDGEIVTMDGESRDIESSRIDTYRYGNLVGDYLRLPVYYNYLLVKGKCRLKLKYQLKRNQ